MARAIAALNDPQGVSMVRGVIEFEEERVSMFRQKVRVRVRLQGLSPGKHGLHIHRTGDLSRGCASLCDHFNPDGRSHGAPTDVNRHVGDLGNVVADMTGQAVVEFLDDRIKLRGCKYNIIGRSVVVHAKEDDLGRGGDAESLRTGNAGARVACGVIGYAE
jgi:Cu-Zn family superoxide dismutase